VMAVAERDVVLPWSVALAGGTQNPSELHTGDEYARGAG